MYYCPVCVLKAMRRDQCPLPRVGRTRAARDLPTNHMGKYLEMRVKACLLKERHRLRQAGTNVEMVSVGWRVVVTRV